MVNELNGTENVAGGGSEQNSRSPEYFLSTAPSLVNGLLLTVDVNKSDNEKLYFSEYPTSCSSMWFYIPANLIGSIERVGLDTCCDRTFHTVVVQIKKEHEAILPLVKRAFSNQPRGQSGSMSPDYYVYFQPTGEGKIAYWNEGHDWEIGSKHDCRMKDGSSILIRPNGTGVVKFDCMSIDTNDELYVDYGFYTHDGAWYAPNIIAYRNMDGNSCTNKWCYHEHQFSFNPSYYDGIAKVYRNGQC